jgi:hypothetical protein
MKSIFQTLPQMLRQEGKAEELNESLVFVAWRRIIGEELRERAVPFRLYQKHLIVAVEDDVWKRHLEALSGQMLFKLNATLGRPTVTFIEFRVDEKTVQEERERRYKEEISRLERERIAMKNVPENVAKAAENIEDDDLRKNFLLAAGSCLARRKNPKSKI